MKNKKAVEMVPAIIITFVILLIVLAVMIFIFRTYIGKETAVIEEQLTSFGDADGDGVRNFLDKCPCTSFEEGKESEEYTGCPAGKTPPKPKLTKCP